MTQGAAQGAPQPAVAQRAESEQFGLLVVLIVRQRRSDDFAVLFEPLKYDVYWCGVVCRNSNDTAKRIYRRARGGCASRSSFVLHAAGGDGRSKPSEVRPKFIPEAHATVELLLEIESRHGGGSTCRSDAQPRYDMAASSRKLLKLWTADRTLRNEMTSRVPCEGGVAQWPPPLTSTLSMGK